MHAIQQIPPLYWVVASLFSVYYAYRGAVGNWLAHRAANAERARKQEALFPKWAIVSVYCAHDALFHSVGSIAGFVSLFIANRLYGDLATAATFDGARAGLLVFTFLFGLIGATGQLPQLILQGKLPGLR